MASTSEDEKYPKLVDEVPLNKPRSLESLCIGYISNHPNVLFCDIKVL